MAKTIEVERISLRYDYRQIAEKHRRDIEEFARAIHRHQRQIYRHQQGIAGDMIAIGEFLLMARELLPHGQFAAWWQIEFEYSTRMVQQMMNVARRFGGSNARARAHLSDSTLRVLASPSVPDEAVDEVLQLAETLGRPPTVVETQEIIDAHKPAPKLIVLHGPEAIEVKATGTLALPAPREVVTIAETNAQLTEEEAAAQEEAEASRRRVRILTTGTAGEVNFEWHLEQASEQELAYALAIITEVENPEDYAEVRNKIATRLGDLMAARQVQQGQAGLLKRLVAVKDLLYDIDEEFPDIHRLTIDVRPPLNRLVTALSNKVR